MKPASTFSSYPEKKHTLLVAVFLVVLYAVFSMCDNLKGIFIPIYKEEFLLSDTQAGAISTSAMLALSIFQYLSSLIVGRLGYKRLLIISFIVVGDLPGYSNELYSRLLRPGQFCHTKGCRHPFRKRNILALVLPIFTDSLWDYVYLGHFS